MLVCRCVLYQNEGLYNFIFNKKELQINMIGARSSARLIEKDTVAEYHRTISAV